MGARSVRHPVGRPLIRPRGKNGGNPLGSFNGLSANGTWSLYFGDAAADGATLNSWSTDITPVPEPVNVALIAFGMLVLGKALIRHTHKAGV